MRRPSVLALVTVLASAACTTTVSPTHAPSLTQFEATATPTATAASDTAAPSSSSEPRGPVTADSIAFWSASRGIAAGTDLDGRGVIWLTSDGGRTWLASKPGLPSISFVTTLGSSNAWAINTCTDASYEGPCSIWSSHDGGVSWANISSAPLQAISFVDATHGWGVLDTLPVAGGSTTSGVFRTSDGGKTWTELPGRPCGDIGGPVAVSFGATTRGWIGCLGDGGAGQNAKGIVETVDGGLTWSIRAAAYIYDQKPIGTISSSDYLLGLSMRPSGVGLAWEARGATIRTSDGGRAWTEMPPGQPDTVIAHGGWAATDTIWYLVMWDGNIQDTALWVTRDAGRHWASVGPVPPVR